jgi:nucleoside-diphosphate-sugar epimerase
LSILIIGRGYLGSRFAELFSDEDAYCTTRTPGKGAPDRCERWLVCDVTRPETLNILPQVDQVLYAVGHDRSSGVTRRDLYVGGLRNVLDRLPRAGRLVYVSSTSVYGQADGSWVDEECPAAPVDEAGSIMLDAEKILRSRCPEAIVLRLAGIYGPGRLPNLGPIRAGEAINGEPDRWLNLIHVDDAAAAIAAAFERGTVSSTYNVADGSPCTRRQFYQELARLVGTPAPRFARESPGRGDSANRRIAVERMREELQVRPRFPSYQEGLQNALAAE